MMGARWPFVDTVDEKYPEVSNCGPIGYSLLDTFGRAISPSSYLKLDYTSGIL